MSGNDVKDSVEITAVPYSFHCQHFRIIRVPSLTLAMLPLEGAANNCGPSPNLAALNVMSEENSTGVWQLIES
jgi:hypothetical protein